MRGIYTMKTFKRILKSTIAFSFIFIFEKYLFGLLYFKFNSNQILSKSDAIYASFLDKANTIISNEPIITIIFIIQTIIELIAFSVFASYIFTYILNREPKLIFPEKLVIRHRTSEGSEGKLRLGVLIGNKSKLNIHNVTCTITFCYVKSENPLLKNAEVKIREEQPVLQNYFRFSFDLNDFPKKLLKDFLNKSAIPYQEDTINIVLTGNANSWGNNFRIARIYHLSDIVFDEHTPDITAYIRNPFTGNKLWKYIRWSEITKTVDVDEDSRASTINEIKQLIEQSAKY